MSRAGPGRTAVPGRRQGLDRSPPPDAETADGTDDAELSGVAETPLPLHVEPARSTGRRIMGGRVQTP